MQDEDKEILQLLGKRIADLREKRKQTLENTCYKNFLTPATLSRIEKAQVEPKYLTLVKIAKAFDMTLSELLDF